jgi:hypothetical protein
MARRKEAFLVTLWFEPRDPEEPGAETWRGSVVHLATKQRRYFSDFLDLCTFLAAHASSSVLEHGPPEADAGRLR